MCKISNQLGHSFPYGPRQTVELAPHRGRARSVHCEAGPPQGQGVRHPARQAGVGIALAHMAQQSVGSYTVYIVLIIELMIHNVRAFIVVYLSEIS